MIVRPWARSSAPPSAVWTLLLNLYDLELRGIDVVRALNLAGAVADHTWIAVGTLSVVAWHVIPPEWVCL